MKLNLLSIVKECNFEDLIEKVSDLIFSYNAIDEDVYFYEEVKYKGYEIDINGKCNVYVSGRTVAYHDAPDEFWATSKDVTVEFGEINIYKKGFIKDFILENSHEAEREIEKFIKKYI